MPLPSEKQNVIVICGPTGIGKTSTAIEIARTFQGQIIGADSMQIYRYMDIGTAKPTPSEQAKIRHHMIDIVDPDHPYDAVKYAQMAREKISQIHSKGFAPFVVGGTGLYIKALLYGMFQAPPVDPQISMDLRKIAADRGSVLLHQRLQSCDPDTAKRIHPNDTYRITRALETIAATGKSITRYQKEHGFADDVFRVLKIGLSIDRKVLYERIDRRVEAMIAQGLVNEVKTLLRMGYNSDLKSMQSIGYRHILEFLADKTSWDECVRTLKRDTRRYAKRQLTWFGADEGIIWQEPKEVKKAMLLVEKFLTSP
jgi:tRNA dimethylallyltransferase